MPMFTWVYHYRYWDERRQENVVSNLMFTLEAIRSGLGVAIIESGRKVRIDQVDEAGQLKSPRPQRDREEA